MLSGGMILGLWVGAWTLWRLTQYTPFYSQTVTISGTVADDTAYGPNGDQRLRLRKVTIDDKPLHGETWVSTTTKVEIKRGDSVSFHGRLGEGFGNISGSMFRAQLVKAERPEPGDVARRARDWFADGVRVALPEPQASLGISYLMGQRKALPEILAEEFRLLGLVHLVVASGFHLTIAVQFTRRLFTRLSKYLVAASTSTVIFAFLLLTGFSTSMTRASLVAGLSLVAWYYGRTVHPAVLLLFVAALTVLIDPRFLWGDIGWYLSFAAFAGVIILAPLIHRYFWGEKKPSAVRYLLVATISAQLTTLPIIALAFAEYSPLSLLANLLVVPLAPLAMLLTLISGVAGIMMPSIAEVVALPAQGILQYMTSVTHWLSGTPWATSAISVNIPIVIGAYTGMVVLILLLLWRTGYNLRRSNLLEE